MSDVGSVRVRFACPKETKPGSRVLILRGELAQRTARGMLDILEPDSQPLEKGPYKPDDAGRINDLSTRVLRHQDMQEILAHTCHFTTSDKQGQEIAGMVYGMTVKLTEGHIHASSAIMSPANLIEHSQVETDSSTVLAASAEEIAVLVAALFRLKQLKAFLSESVFSSAGAVLRCTGVCVLDSAEAPLVNIAMGTEQHPPVTALTVYGDREVEQVLTMLRILNSSMNSGEISDVSDILQVLSLTDSLEHSVVQRLFARVSINKASLPTA